MIFNLLTFLAALSVAGVAEWFSIVGIISIYAGAPYNAGLILGLVLGFAKLVNTSWLYRNWDKTTWKIKGPLIYFLLALMIATSMGVFGFLTKSHLEQGAATVDNSAKVERLDQQITREKGTIADDEKIITQLDAAINSYIGKDKTDKAVAIRKSQAPQRKQLRDDIDASQKKIDGYSEDKLKLTSEVRALQLEVGPIRYIAELFYGTGGDQNANIESAVKMFTLLIVSTLDPLAIILLIAANHTLMQRQNEKKEKATTKSGFGFPSNELDAGNDTIEIAEKIPPLPVTETTGQINDTVDRVKIHEEQNPSVDEESLAPNIGNIGIINEEEKVNEVPAASGEPVLEIYRVPEYTDPETVLVVQHGEAESTEAEAVPREVLLLNEEEETPKSFYRPAVSQAAPAIIRSPSISRVEEADALPAADKITIRPEVVQIPIAKNSIVEDAVLRELRGPGPHFIPQKINEETKQTRAAETTRLVSENEAPETGSKSAIAKAVQEVESSRSEEVQAPANTAVTVLNGVNLPAQTDKYPVRLSWLKEFKGD